MYIRGLTGNPLLLKSPFTANIVVQTNCSTIFFQGYNWRIHIEYFKRAPSLKTVTLQLFQVQAV